jgi:hypothetical protein
MNLKADKICVEFVMYSGKRQITDSVKIRERETRSRKERNGNCLLFNNNAVSGV